MMYAAFLRESLRLIGSAAIGMALVLPAFAQDVPAKKLFGAQKLPALMQPQSAGFYSKGCLAGGVAIPVDGPAWQVMRLSRNRNWGHPDLIKTVQQLALDGQKAGWGGLLVGDISQPRGGPMLTGHASHQIGLDADIWLTPMPGRTLTKQEREDLSATSMLKGDSLYVDPDIWTPGQAAILKTAASYPQVERILVHPGIKKKLCDTVTGDRTWLSKVRPYWGHNYHFHMRIKCPPGSVGCKGQAAVAAGDGCGKDLAWWFTDEPWKPAKKPAKPVKPKIVTLKDLPPVCAQVLDAAAPASAADVTLGLQ
ncbi:MAG: penicillin-insensitive murein endopeptidase [Rhizobiaceae bacterium]